MTSDEVGRRIADLRTGLGMRIFRGERVVGCWEEDARALAAADVIVVIVRATLND